MESKYTKHEKEIIEMHLNDKSAAEIAGTLNEKYPGLNAAKTSIRGIIKKYKDEKTQACTEKMLPEDRERISGEEKIKEKSLPKQEIITAEKMEKLIINEAQMRMTARDFSLVTEKYQKAFAVFSIICNEFGEVTEKLRKRAKEKSIYLIFAGIWLLSLLFTMIGSYYIGHCFYKTALLYGMNLLGIPAGFLLGLGVGLAINLNKRRKKAECKKS